MSIDSSPFANWENIDCVCFDVDSTVCTDEGIDELADFCQVGEQVKLMTKKAMEGGVTFREALKMRLDLMQPSRLLVDQYIQTHPPKLTPGVQELVTRLQQRGVAVYLISGGFQSIIAPAAQLLHIPAENVFANQFLFHADEIGSYAGFDESTLTSESGGKGRVVEYLKSTQQYQAIAFIGDGATDLEAVPPANVFLGFGGNVVRESVRAKASHYFYSMQEIIAFFIAKGLFHKS